MLWSIESTVDQSIVEYLNYNFLMEIQRYATRADAQAVIQEYIESFYNRQRRHSRLRNMSPILFADNFYRQSQAA